MSNLDHITANITENKLADFEGNPELKETPEPGSTTVSSYNEEAEQFAVQHRVNKLKQHHRRAFELISRALKIDEDVGNKDGTTVELYKKGEDQSFLIFCDFYKIHISRNRRARERSFAGI